ncbi:aspartyl/asparaginyl beta-hydroxylase domain-containing protein [Inhella gelatinilytica]|uniref:Aspartyl/asparaginyl beta-hydroxylase domain-containing protein n=1 Tax=Inhella gelatinilytica TaxID=2795030 RepID=A0A931NC86_9BURK|nr:aspartyl/asparaginyl beta-hydroxylase domain-containing protein [Inhella gelatinilytica]MBH9551717.1 aspartyl/asparaginyl beta-hydroxylase domain-containing protein [Inhella gelatinilytica]
MSALNAGLQRARALLEDRQALAAELQLRRLVQEHPGSPVPRAWLGALALQREDAEQAIEWFEGARTLLPDDADLVAQLAQAHCEAQAADKALVLLREFVAGHPAAYETQLVLANLLDEMGQSAASVAVGLRALTAAQARGQWMDVTTTPPHLHDGVAWWSERVRKERKALAQSVLDEQVARFGRSEMRRFEDCVRYFLGEAPELAPPQSRQQPKFLYFPGLPEGPYHDPALQPWLPELLAAYPQIRAEGLAMLGGDGTGREDFLGFKPGDDRSKYVGGDGANPAWDAWFFYRHGQRYEANHRLAPATSAALSRIELCEVEGQAPEICFSLLAPGSLIKRHFGVTNTRLVFHLPLRVPSGCALHVFGDAPHEWQEGRPMMFDDTFEHEAWNRSDAPRLILLMDCWNPHLTLPERHAVRQFAERMTRFENADSLS